MKHLFLGIAILSVAASSQVFAGTPAYNFYRSFPTTGTVTYRMTSALSDSTGGVYFTDNNSDNVYYIADPLTATGSSGIVQAIPGSVAGFGSGSYASGGIDSAGTVFISGSDSGPQSVVVSITGGPTGPWTGTKITLPAAYASGGTIRLGGCDVVGVNKIVAPNYNTGQLHFFTISGSTATEDAGSPVAAPSGFSGIASSVKYDATAGKIYMAHTVLSTSNGGLYVFNSNGTPAGTSAITAQNPYLADASGQSSTNSAQYCTVSIEPTTQVAMVNQGGNAVGQNAWRLVDTSATGPTTPYQTINLTEPGAPGALGAADAALGHTFFTKAGVRYLIVGDEDAPRFFAIYRNPPATVAEWSMY